MSIKLILNKLLAFFLSFFVINFSLALPSESVKENQIQALFSAILNEDVELYSKEMEKLLNGSIKDFIKVIHETKNGDSIFHLMAGVKSNQDFFAKEIQNLINAMSPTQLVKSGGDLSLGQVKIDIPLLEDTKLGKAIMRQDVSAIVSIVNDLDKTVATEALSFFHARSRYGSSMKDFLFDSLSMSQLLELRDQGLEEKVAKYTPNPFYLLSLKNKEGDSIIYATYRNGNIPAFSVVKPFFYWKTTPLISAILNENVDLYSKEMSHLLRLPVNVFRKEVLFKKQIGTIFHLMARVKSNKDFFNKEIQNLIHAFSPGQLAKSGDDLSLGRVIINIPSLENTKLGKAIIQKDVSAIVSIINQLDKTSTIDVLSLLHARSNKGLSLKDFTAEHLSQDQLFYIKKKGFRKKVSKYTPTFSDLLSSKNKNIDQKIIDIATNKNENLLPSALIADYNIQEAENKLSIIIPGGMIGTLVAGLTPSYIFSTYPDFIGGSTEDILIAYITSTFIGTIGGLAIGSFGSSRCYKLFQKTKINKIHRKHISQNSQNN